MTPERRRENARQALVALQGGEVTRVMGHAATPAEIRLKADDDSRYLHSLADRVEALAKIFRGPTPNRGRRSKRTSRRAKRTSRRAR